MRSFEIRGSGGDYKFILSLGEVDDTLAVSLSTVTILRHVASECSVNFFRIFLLLKNDFYEIVESINKIYRLSVIYDKCLVRIQ